ncbi:angiogenin isoform X1 [Zootoca vivipara]|uniref:angiogenin isoform X1 n=2 Tax=Zootoca vivipara TaxID=8524 RepID=UPI00293B8880|nr:angiogenin isoform X1 [Zootoca vivipara]
MKLFANFSLAQKHNRVENQQLDLCGAESNMVPLQNVLGRMRLSRGACCLFLAVLLSHLLCESSCGNNPRYEKFLSQHRDEPRSRFHGRYCNTLMGSRGLTKPECKEVNTFIHGSKRQIRAVCAEGGLPSGELRKSRQHFRVTTCTLRGGSTRPPCEYKENISPRYIIIGCEGGWPVHYDESQIVTSV